MGRGGNAGVGDAGRHRPCRGSTSCHPPLASVLCITHGSVGRAARTELLAAGGVNGANSSSSSSTSSSAREAQDTGRPMSKATVAISEGRGAHWSRGESSSRWRRATAGDASETGAVGDESVTSAAGDDGGRTEAAPAVAGAEVCQSRCRRLLLEERMCHPSPLDGWVGAAGGEGGRGESGRGSWSGGRRGAGVMGIW